METRSIRGFHDVLPEEIKRWHHIEEEAKSVFELHGFSELRMPVLEFTEIFARSLGTTTDIVEKEMYTFQDRDGSSLTLRPEGTAGVVRAYIENSMWARSPVTKLYYTGMMFRHERPQKGRFRGFYQIGAELLGPEEPPSDAELIAMVWKLLEGIGITKYLKLELSSLGDGNCRPQYKEMLIAFFTPEKERLCEDCRRRLGTNPLRILDCKVKGCREIAARAPRMIDNLCGDCSRTAHSGHVVHPYRYVDWGGHPPHGLAAELGELIGDAAQALQAGLAELLPRVKRGHHGVIFSDDDEPSSADNVGPVRKFRRWLASL